MWADIRIVDPPRSGRWCLGLQDDSVFADFDLDVEGHVFLLRISFDGYGCNNPDQPVPSMNAETSRSFLSLIESDVRSLEMRSILSKYFADNCDLLWQDALEDHGLIRANVAEGDKH